MPYKTVSTWVDPSQLLTHKGVTIYHTYEDEDIDNGADDFCFITKERSDSYEWFDVRELPNWKEPKKPPFLNTGKHDTPKNRKLWEVYLKVTRPEAIKRTIKEAIDLGLINADGVDKAKVEAYQLKQLGVS